MAWGFSLLAYFPRALWAVSALFFLAAAVIDYRSGKIPNRLALLFLAWSVAACFYAAFSGPVFSPLPLLGAAIGLTVAVALLFPLFVLGVFGGGDVKLFFAAAPLLGGAGVLSLFFWSVLIAGAGSLALMARHRRVGAFAAEIGRFLRSLALPQMKLEWPRLRRDIVAPFGVAIFVGFLVHSFREGWVR